MERVSWVSEVVREVLEAGEPEVPGEELRRWWYCGTRWDGVH